MLLRATLPVTWQAFWKHTLKKHNRKQEEGGGSASASVSGGETKGTASAAAAPLSSTTTAAAPLSPLSFVLQEEETLPHLEEAEEWRYKWLVRRKLLLCSMPLHKSLVPHAIQQRKGGEEGGGGGVDDDAAKGVMGAAATAASASSSSSSSASDSATSEGTVELHGAESETTSVLDGGDNGEGESSGENELARKAFSAKRMLLLDILSHCNNVKGAFNQRTTFTDALRMVRCNLFRPLRLGSVGVEFDDDDPDMAFLDPDWPHVSIVYELLLTLVMSNSVDLTIKRKVIDQSFLLSLLDLFGSQDARERDYLKTVTHRIYGKLTNRRMLIRRSISNIFYQYAWEGTRDGTEGIAELLEILGSIINGFSVPIKAEHETLLCRALVPLHKSRDVTMFQPQLQFCMVQYVEKEGRFADPVVKGILKYWPFSSSAKAVLFLGEIEEVLECETVDSEIFMMMERPLFVRLRRCLLSDHWQVSLLIDSISLTYTKRH